MRVDGAGVEIEVPASWTIEAPLTSNAAAARGPDGRVDVYLFTDTKLRDHFGGTTQSVSLVAVVMSWRKLDELGAELRWLPAYEARNEPIVSSTRTPAAYEVNVPLTEVNEYASGAEVDRLVDSQRGIVYLRCSLEGRDARARALALLDTAKVDR